jgi:hypothetical protein
LKAQNDAMRALYKADSTEADLSVGRQLAQQARRLSALIRESKVRELTADERREVEDMFEGWKPPM